MYRKKLPFKSMKPFCKVCDFNYCLVLLGDIPTCIHIINNVNSMNSCDCCTKSYQLELF